jgi:hypothetical protein
VVSRLLVGGFSAVVLIAIFINGELGISSEFGTGGIHVSAHLSPFILMAWPFAIAALAISFSLKNVDGIFGFAKWPRILLALFIDFGLIFISVVVPLCFAVLFIEYTQVGDFSWQFSRTFSRSTDIITAILSLVMFCILFASFGIFLLNNRKTPGSLLAGLKLKISEPIKLWQCSVFGLFKYFELAFPIIAVNKRTLGGFELTAQLESTIVKKSVGYF